MPSNARSPRNRLLLRRYWRAGARCPERLHALPARASVARPPTFGHLGCRRQRVVAACRFGKHRVYQVARAKIDARGLGGAVFCPRLETPESGLGTVAFVAVVPSHGYQDTAPLGRSDNWRQDGRASQGPWRRFWQKARRKQCAAAYGPLAHPGTVIAALLTPIR